MRWLKVGDTDTGTALDDVEYLARSPHRVRVLETLRAGPHDRSAIQTETGATRSTLGRILGEFEERGWVRRNGATYELTPLGDFLAAQFHSLLEGVATMEKLREVAHLLPTEEFDFGLDHFADARITLSKLHDSIAPVQRSLEAGKAAEDWRIVTPAIAPHAHELAWQLVSQGDLRFEAVFTEQVMETILADEEMTRQLSEIVRADGGEVFRYDGEVPCIIGVWGDTAFLGLSEPSGAPRALIEVDDEVVTEWAHRTVDEYREKAEPVDPDSIE